MSRPITDSRFRAIIAVMLVLVLAFLAYKFAGWAILPRQTQLPGPRYFNGYVSESEIYAGAIMLAFEDGDFAIVYLQETTSERRRKRLPAAVEKLARKPLRPIVAAQEVAPLKVPIRRVANSAGLIGEDKLVINRGLFIAVGPIRKIWLNSIRISVHDSLAGGNHTWVDYMVIMSNGRLVFVPISMTMT